MRHRRPQPEKQCADNQLGTKFRERGLSLYLAVFSFPLSRLNRLPVAAHDDNRSTKNPHKATTENLPSNCNPPAASVSNSCSGNAILPLFGIRPICRSYVVAEEISCSPHSHRTSGILLPRDGVRLGLLRPVRHRHVSQSAPEIWPDGLHEWCERASKPRHHQIAVSRRDGNPLELRHN